MTFKKTTIHNSFTHYSRRHQRRRSAGFNFIFGNIYQMNESDVEQSAPDRFSLRKCKSHEVHGCSNVMVKEVGLINYLLDFSLAFFGMRLHERRTHGLGRKVRVATEM